MKFLKILSILIVLALLVALGFSWHAGFFRQVSVQEQTVGPYFFVQVERYGDYADTPKYQDSIYYALKKEGIETYKGFGIFYDDPNDPKKSPDQLHSIVGCVLEPSDSAQIPELTRRGFRIERMGETPSMVVEFPRKSDLSIMAGVLKAYPALEKYRQENGFQSKPALEIYENDLIIYSMEIAEN